MNPLTYFQQPKSKGCEDCGCCTNHNSATSEDDDHVDQMEETEEMRAMMVRTLMHTFPEFCRLPFFLNEFTFKTQPKDPAVSSMQS